MVACFFMPKIGIQCERLREKEQSLEPLVLLNEKKVVVVASAESETAGVFAGQSFSASLTLCPTLTSMPYDRATYETMASTVWDLLARESSFVEPVSPERCYVVLDEMLAYSQVQLLRKLIGEIGIDDVRIGIGRTKLIAWHAATLTGPHEHRFVDFREETRLIGRMKMAGLPIDPKLMVRMHKLGLTQLKDVVDVDGRRFSRPMKEALQTLQQFAQGNDGDPVKQAWPPAELWASHAFDDAVPPWELLEAAITRHCVRMADELLRRRNYCRTLTLTVTLDGGEKIEATEKLAAPISTAAQLTRTVSRQLRRLYSSHLKRCTHEEHMFSVISFRIVCAGLDIGSGIQQTLLDIHGNALPDERRRSLDKVLNFARGRWGEKMVVDASYHLSEGQRTLYTQTLGARLNEEIEFETRDDEPCRYRRKDQYAVQVTGTVDRWHERRWHAGQDIDRWVFQVQTAHGLAEISRTGKDWLLMAMAD